MARPVPATSLAAATAHAAAGFLCYVIGDRPAIEAHAQASIRIGEAAGGGPGFAWSTAWPTIDLGELAQVDGDLVAARELHTRAMAISQVRAADVAVSRGQLFAEARSHQQLAYVADAEGIPDVALSHAVKALDLCRSLGNKPGVSRMYYTLGVLHRGQGDLDAASVDFADSLGWAGKAGDKIGIRACHEQLGALAYQSGRAELAREHYEHSLATARDMAMPPDWEAKFWTDAGTTALEHGDTDAAERWLSFADSLVAKRAGLRDSPDGVATRSSAY